MVLLPIVERELRVAARSKQMHRIRLWTTAAGLLCLVPLFFTPFMRNLGSTVYNIVTYYAFILSLLAGVFLAADAVSSEKREGTLGLLFLTDLKGYDVVLGKFAATGLNALFGLVAVLPVTGLPLLAGGVTGAEFWRISLALVNTLFFAMASGMLVSTWSRDAGKAVSTATFFLVIAVVGLPIIASILSATPLPPTWWYATSFSPYFPFKYGASALYVTWHERYWISLGVSNLFGWLMLALASATLPSAWQDRPFKAKAPVRVAVGSKALSSFARRAKLLNVNPILWLAGNDEGAVRWSWIIALSCAAVVGGIFALDSSFSGVTFATVVIWIFGLMLKIRMAFQSCQFFVNVRRSGAMEMLLSTPLTTGQIIRGQWLALKRIFLWPSVIILALQLVLLINLQSVNTFQRPYAVGPRAFFGMGFMSFPFGIFSPVSGIYQLVRWVTDMLALGWMGMWLGLSAKKPGLAGIMNFLFVMVLPNLIFCVPDVFVDLFFIFWARDRLMSQFRSLAMPHYLPSVFSVRFHVKER